VVGLLRDLDPGLIGKMVSLSDTFLPSWGVTFVAPNGEGIDLPFQKMGDSSKNPPGFVTRRVDFDHFLMEQLDPEWTTSFWNADVQSLSETNDFVLIKGLLDDQPFECRAQLVVGADGVQSVVARQLAKQRIQSEHLLAGFRRYYENVADMHPQNFIELHFISEALPGYLWIFPLTNNQANVGIGMLSSSLKKHHLNLKQIFENALEQNPTLAKRFKNARPLETTQGWRLPLGSIQRPLSGNRYILTGDAAALIDPFTGEGIGNAILSAKKAAPILAEAVKRSEYSANFLKQYDQRLYQNLWHELQVSHKLQQLVKYPWLFNFVINKVHKNKSLQDTFSAMFNDVDMRAKLRSPLFYFRLLFGR